MRKKNYRVDTVLYKQTCTVLNLDKLFNYFVFTFLTDSMSVFYLTTKIRSSLTIYSMVNHTRTLQARALCNFDSETCIPWTQTFECVCVWTPWKVCAFQRILASASTVYIKNGVMCEQHGALTVQNVLPVPTLYYIQCYIQYSCTWIHVFLQSYFGITLCRFGTERESFQTAN